MISTSGTNAGLLKITPLGAGQDVGKSCILVEFPASLTTSNNDANNNKRPKVENESSALPPTIVMLDCGLHIGDAEKPFPDFEKGLGPSKHCDAVLITHYHIDHVGGLPVLTESFGYTGPVFMSPPTLELSPLMIEESFNNKLRGGYSFNAREISSCFSKCTTINCRETITLYSKCNQKIEITAFRAGHVLGAVMFHVRVGDATVLYTGDFNSSPDRTLGAADPLPLPPPYFNTQLDVLISESTYGATTRGSVRSQEIEFLNLVGGTMVRGGKVLIPTFSLGRVQEICALLEDHWMRCGLKVPIILSTREAAKVNDVHARYAQWGSTELGDASVDQIAGGQLKFVRVGEPTANEIKPGVPLVLLACSGMMVGGLALKMFKQWCKDRNNTVIFPGHCVKGTPGYQLLNMKIPGKLRLEQTNETFEVNCQVFMAPFSAHTDAKGILKCVHQTKPRNIVFVHGVVMQMEALRRRVERERPGTRVEGPENHQMVEFPVLGSSQQLQQGKVEVEYCISLDVPLRKSPSEAFAEIKTMFESMLAVVNETTMVPNDGSSIEIKLESKHVVIVWTREVDDDKATQWADQLKVVVASGVS